MAKRWRTFAVVLTVAAVVPVTSGIAAGREASNVDAKLVGKWTRKVTSADVKRAQAFGGVPVGEVVTLAIKKSGDTKISTGNGDLDFSGKVVPAGTGRIHIYVPLVFPNVYRWSVSGQRLTFTPVSVSHGGEDTEAVFWGVWKRK
jgi:hypothetical protein